MSIGHPAYFDSTPGNIQPDDRHHEGLIQPELHQIIPPPLKVPYMESPRGKFAVSAFNPLKTGHHYSGWYGAMYDEAEVENAADRTNWAYLAIREDFWPVSNEQIVIPPAQPVTPDIYRQTYQKFVSPSLSGAAPTQGVYTGIAFTPTQGFTVGSGYSSYGSEPE